MAKMLLLRLMMGSLLLKGGNIMTLDDNVVRRSGEEEKLSTFRSNRFFISDSDWYFNTREGTSEGPYVSRVLAHEANQQYIREKQSLDS